MLGAIPRILRDRRRGASRSRHKRPQKRGERPKERGRARDMTGALTFQMQSLILGLRLPELSSSSPLLKSEKGNRPQNKNAGERVLRPEAFITFSQVSVYHERNGRQYPARKRLITKVAACYAVNFRHSSCAAVTCPGATTTQYCRQQAATPRHSALLVRWIWLHR